LAGLTGETVSEASFLSTGDVIGFLNYTFEPTGIVVLLTIVLLERCPNVPDDY